MKYISIGNACSVKYNIDKYRGKSETLFFDWLMTSMDSVIEILNCNNINNILYSDNIVRDSDNPYHCNNSRIIIKSLNYCVSIHDLSKNYTDDDFLNFIDKYSRRFERIIEYIKSNEQICFIRMGYVSCDKIYKFIETIKKINSNCDFTIVVIDNNKENKPEIIKQHNLLYIKLNVDIPIGEIDWTQQFLNWNSIFIEIEKNIKSAF
jgi:hypothetical protein